jgi:hypothetical protein
VIRIHIEYSGKNIRKRNRYGFNIREEMLLKYRIAQNIMMEAEADPEFAEDISETDSFMEEVQLRFMDLEEMKAEADRLEGGWFRKLIYRLSPI